MTKAAGCLDLNIREEADPARVRPRDDAGDASDVRLFLLLAPPSEC